MNGTKILSKKFRPRSQLNDVLISLTTEEKRLAENYSKIHSLSIEQAFKQALFELIEDEYDQSVADEAHAEYVNDGEWSAPISELWTELGL